MLRYRGSLKRKAIAIMKLDSVLERLNQPIQAPETVAKKSVQSVRYWYFFRQQQKTCEGDRFDVDLSKELWETDIHEAHVLVLVEPFPETSVDDLSNWVNAIATWDICIFSAARGEKT